MEESKGTKMTDKESISQVILEESMKEKLEKFIEDSSREDVKNYLKNLDDRINYYSKKVKDYNEHSSLIPISIFDYLDSKDIIYECQEIKIIIENKIKQIETEKLLSKNQNRNS